MRKRVPPEEFCGCIDPPGPWAPLRAQREFLASLDDLPECDLIRSLREQALEYIRLAEENPMFRKPSDLN